MAEHQTTTPEQNTRPGHQNRTSTWHDHLALVPWSAGLLAAGYYQSDLAHQTFHWNYPWALAFPLAIEAAVAWSAGNFHRRLVRRDSAIGARIWLLILMGFSCSLLFWHAKHSGTPIEGALAISAMTIISAGVWLQRASSTRRDLMRSKGLVYPATPNYPMYRWLLCPIETWKAFRYGIKNGIEDPLEALQGLNPSSRTQASRTLRPKPTPERAESSEQNAVPEAEQHTQIRTRLISTDELTYITAIQTHPEWPNVSITQIQNTIAGIDPSGTCGKSRAIRLRAKAIESELLTGQEAEQKTGTDQ